MAESAPLVNLGDFEVAARQKMDKVDYDYYAAGGEDEITLRRNREAWPRIVLWPRFLRDMSTLTVGTRILGEDVAMPVICPPMAMQKLAHPDGEVGLARAVHAAGLIYCITQQATTKLETICEQAPGPKFFQMYMFTDREMSEKLIRRAEASGVKALVVTVDSPVLGRRERDLRNKFTPKSRGVELVNWADDKSKSTGDGSAASMVKARTGGRDSGFSWPNLEWLRSTTQLPLILKGIVHPADANMAVEHGCAAVWVSNHGGRQLDGGPATAEALPLVVQAVRGRVPVIVDGGISRGSDVLRALALGATAACVGRPLLWALATDGEQAASQALTMLREELSTAMALSGVQSVTAVPRNLVQAPGDAFPVASL